MQAYSENYLSNRRDFYATLLSRIPDPDFVAALREALGPPDDSAETTKQLQELPKSTDGHPDLEALALDDLLKKQGIGPRLAKQVISIRGVFQVAEHVERVGLIWFQTVGNKKLGDSAWVNALAAARLSCLMRLLKLRDAMDFHRFKLVKS